MALSAKDVAQRILDEMPDTASLSDIAYAMFVRMKIDRGLLPVENENVVAEEDVQREMETLRASVPRRPVRKGHVTVREAVFPVPPLSVEAVNDLIDTIRLERERQLLRPVDDRASRRF